LFVISIAGVGSMWTRLSVYRSRFLALFFSNNP